ncbi:MAG: HlyD family secretion protein [Burkholderia sp.]|jgi:membrane fusion protein (multidrug efflux system)|uniref:HlyD family secretion protein n=1 Tax=Burkholderia sp. TaxID=36773 RepID=UPI002586FE1B|nr:HlyD family secretion protein [Burkholderia sp.]MCA3777798.1 HlyD family secretion protein [Burkholderia sp.]MCA3783744.1 HlyD family secretion protein [Burkholderia sp.]MCA3793758.1 HlyD family secretion protein [Burkholderia sp.]MCA3802423.1 HlyD family secretion protein [Burkholderia sp.]MCA3816407.1 HlyD family secretion protein [Burkholderia sp.]
METTQAAAATREAATTERPVKQRRVPWMRIAVGVTVVVVAAAVLDWLFVLRFQESTDDAYVGGDVTVLAPKVNGFVDKILVTDNQRVKSGDVLVQLDARDYDAKLAQATAEVDSARSAVTELEAKQQLQFAVIGQHAADKNASSAELTRAASDRVRYRELVKSDAVSNQIVERADADYSKAGAAVERSDAALLASKRQLDVLGAQLADAQARVNTALAAQRVAALNVEYTTIRSPVDGYVGNRTGRVGMLANVGVPLLTVVPASGLWIDANFKEDQLRKMRAGDRVDVALDASSTRLHGRVDSVAPATGATFSVLPPENATGNFTKIVQRVPVRVHLDPQPGIEHVLRPGLSAVVTVHTDHAN